MKIRKSLVKLGEKLEGKFKNINWGGCCVVAALVGKELGKLGLEYKIRVATSTISKNTLDELVPMLEIYKEPLERLTQYEKNGVNFWHVFLEVTDSKEHFFWDTGNCGNNTSKFSSGREDLADGEFSGVLPGNLPLSEARDFAQEPEAWNKTFNRKQIPKMKKMIKEHFKELAQTEFSV